MAERSISAFNQEYNFPHIQVFADRNQIEKEETFELPAAARDRFMMEINIDMPADDGLLKELMFNTRFHDVDSLINDMETGKVAYYQLNELAQQIQQKIQPSARLEQYALHLWKASKQPGKFGINLADVEMDQLIQAGAVPEV